MWLVSLRDLQWRRRRFLIAVVATALVFAMSLLMAGADAGLTSETRRIIDVIGADRWLVAKGTSGPFTTATAIPADAAAEVAGLPGVRRADPLVIFHSTLQQTGGLKDVNVIGYRPGGLGAPPLASGRLPSTDGEAVVDTRLGLHVGQTVDIGGHQLRVVGTADNVTYYFGAPTVFMSIADAQALAFRGQPLAMTVVTKGVPVQVPATLQAMTLGQVRTDLDRPSKNGKATIQFLNILLWLVAAGIIASIVYLSILERQRDFAVFKATGASSRSLYGGLALQAVLLSATSALAAAVLAHLLAPGFPFELELTAVAVLRLLVVALVVGLVASLVGLRRAVAVDPALAFGGG
ncbi:MAG: ABC transporter permease [Acidimicrobiia bacterium]|nr:ABC transporter permease [Acidimicrobiia bacterium]